MSRRITRRKFLTGAGAVAAAVATGTLARTVWWDNPASPIAPQPTPYATGTPGVDERADAYLAVAPKVLRANQEEAVSVALFRAGRPAGSTVTVSLLKDDTAVAEAAAWVPGRGDVRLPLPSVPSGDYTLTIDAQGVHDRATVRVEDGTLLFVETDKPIYKPGQTVHIRLLMLDPTLRPASGEATVEALDAKGIKVFKQTVAVDDFGMGTVDLPLSDDLNLGVWKVQATAGQQRAQRDVRVERYVLPKYAVTVSLPKEWALTNEPIAGTVSAEYSFGKPVNGEVEIVASRYVGAWEEYARVSQPLEAARDFQLPPVEYVVGSPTGGGLGSVRLDVTVREQATGYEEQTSRLVTIAASPVNVQMIPDSSTFKPELPLTILVVAQTPDNAPVDADVTVRLNFMDADFQSLPDESHPVAVRNGVGSLTLTPPAKAVSLMAWAEARDATATPLSLRAGYSPSGAFIHVTQVTRGPLTVGDTAEFHVYSTREATGFYYEVLGRGTVVYSDVSPGGDIAVPLTPLMAPEAKLLVYQILPNGEVAADYVPFSVSGDYPQAVTVEPGAEEVRPGDELEVAVQTEGPARVGLVAVDRAVYILAENRLNLQQVFDELERLFMEPQAELHEADPMGGIGIMPWRGPQYPTSIPGARELFTEAGVVVLTNRRVPEAKELNTRASVAADAAEMAVAGSAAMPPAVAQDGAEQAAGEPLAEVQRVREFFPETWIWSDLSTDASGRASQRVTAPDSITTWMLRAVAISKEHGLGVGEAELRVFQPFFVTVDLPYAVTRGEELPANIALYNYQPTTQEFTVDLDAGDWFDALEERTKRVTIEPNSVGAVSFTIRPTGLGVQPLKVTARSREAADAIIKQVIVEPEGVAREEVENVVLVPGTTRTVDLAVPPLAVEGSARAALALTGSMMTQTIEGLEGLLRIPFGCGEQNMILFAPNVFVVRYLEETGQTKPEVMAKAELMMLTGYQRELVYRRNDGSFSAFGQQDQEGSLWLTAFVLKTFAQAQGLIYIDEEVLNTAADWVRAHQRPDGSFTPVGFVHHQEMLGGLQGTTALTAFVAIALHEAGDASGAASAVNYLEGQLDATDDAYALAITTYALALAKSPRAEAARAKLMALAHESDEGLYWGDRPRPLLEPANPAVGPDDPFIPPLPDHSSATIETTGYATLALLALGDRLTAGRAVRWLAAQRNALGGFGSTQDTIVALQAMSTAAADSRADIDATVALSVGSWQKEIQITAANADVLQIVDVPLGDELRIEPRGRGEVMAQAVRRYNLPETGAPAEPIFHLDVSYGTGSIAVNDRIDITATVHFTPPEPIKAGMSIIDIAVPTGFAPVSESLDALVESRRPKLKRWEAASRKVIFYIEDLVPDERLTLTFQAQALYPVRAQAVTSQVYSYYRPDWKAETLAGALTVTG